MASTSSSSTPIRSQSPADPSTFPRLLAHLATRHPDLFPPGSSARAALLASAPAAAPLLAALATTQAEADVFAQLEDRTRDAATTEYDAEALRITRILSNLQITNDRLSSTAEANLHSLASLAITLGLKDTISPPPPTSSYQAAMATAYVDEKQAESELSRQKRLLEAVERRTAGAQRNLQRVRG
ncbi:hypothetical protein BDK51DRAFT_47901 [Blyttiomyces helicus]|uniref:Uncharacterized protein n=1 Tax=Blyttiomyces helicus TaxID=388810 RepID=A0A4P9W2F2_9FUNG|nr:hypothetical protein BDK51DRAFT_47901 [Blyttiomyces helicus]|eukprot:RKO85545.1 hypothetical protein BDK51DRAFT_47901 [Blyttiomyces helicus]